MAGSTTYQYILSLQDRMSGALQRAGATGSRTYDTLQKKQDRLNNSVQGFNTLMNRMGVSFGLFGLFQFGKKILTAGADIEDTRITFQTLLQDIEKGNEMVRKLQNYADITPFESKDLQEAAKMLLNFGVAQEKIMPTLQQLGDISGGNSQKLHSLTLAFSQMSSAGRLMGQDLLQMVNAGFNPLQEINRVTGRSLKDLRKDMEKGAISSAMVEAAFRSATSEGGRFYRMLDRMSKTIKGRWSTFMDKISLTLMKWGDLSNKTVASVLEKFISATNWLYANSERIFEFFRNIGSAFAFVFDGTKKIIAVWVDLYKSLTANRTLIETFQTIFMTIFGLFVAAFKLANRIFVWMISGIAETIKWLNKHAEVLNTLLVILGSMAIAYVAVRAAAIVNNAVMAITTRLALEQALAGRSLTIWQGLAALATKGWSAAMMKLNLTFLASPIFWITAAIVGLIAAIAYVIYKTDGWGNMWKHTVEGAKLIWKSYTDFVKAYFTTMIDGIIIAVDKVLVAFYKAKQAIGIGDAAENQRQIDKFNADAKQRSENIKGAWRAVGEDAKGAAREFKAAAQSLKWNNERTIGGLVKDIKGKLGLNNSEGGNKETVAPDGSNIETAGVGQTISDTGLGIAEGGSRPTTINITLGNLIEEFTINTTNMKEGVEEIERKVRESLLRVLNSANGVAYGN